MSLTSFLDTLWEIITILFWVAVALCFLCCLFGCLTILIAPQCIDFQRRNSAITESSDEETTKARASRGSRSAQAKMYKTSTKNEENAASKAKKKEFLELLV